jgi:RNA-directed DNA polymerase
MPNPSLLIVLARALLAGGQDLGSVIGRIQQAVGRRGLSGIAKRYLAAFAGKTRPRQRDVEQFLLLDRGFARIRSVAGEELPARPSPAHPSPVHQWLTGPQSMLPVPAARLWNLPAIPTIDALCDWLRLTLEEVAWFADLKSLNREKGKETLDHYYYKLVAKRSGDLRVIEAPKQRLKQLQRQILTEVLDLIPVHAAAHGFVRGRSIRSFAAPHVDKHVVLRMDIQNFFPSISAARIGALFRTAGYPEPVANLLAGLCTHTTPNAVWQVHRREIGAEKIFTLRDLYGRPHLPQGAPTSPALANFCAYRIDCRLQGLAKSADAEYTRYADDLAFSGGDAFSRHAGGFLDHAGAILLEEGFRAHYRKTRIMRQGVRQQLAGLVTNRRLNIARDDFDRLKATLTNCIRYGPQSQNRQALPDFRAHLNGRVGFVESIQPVRGAKLRRLFDLIQWPVGLLEEKSSL